MSRRPSSRLNSMATGGFSRTLRGTYDGMGRRSDVNRGPSHTGYGYDGLSRLTSQNQRFAGGSGNLNACFSYNPVGQMGTSINLLPRGDGGLTRLRATSLGV